VIPYVIGGLALSTLALFKTRPHTTSKKRESIGPSGTIYQVDDFADVGVVVVIAPDGSKGVFRRGQPTPTSRGALDFQSGWPQGQNGRNTLLLMLKDFGQDTKPSLVKEASDEKKSGQAKES